MKLNQVPSVGESTTEAIRSLAVSEFMSNFKFGSFAEFYQVSGNADTPRRNDSDMTAGDTRTLSTDYTAKTNTPGFGAVALKIYGDKVKTDVAYERRGYDIGSQRALDVANFAKSLGRFMSDSVINDEISAVKFSGLKQQATTLSLKSVFNSADGGSLPTGNAAADRKLQDAFLELLNLHIALVRPSVIVANAYLLNRLASVGRSYMSTSAISDIYGNQQNITSFAGVPLIDAGYKANNSGLVIDNAEVEGASGAVCTSLYLARFGEQEDVAFATNRGLDVKDLGILGTSYLTMCEMDVDLVVLNNTALRRISGIILG